MPEIYCPQCGSLIPEGETVCPGCGFDLAEYDQEAENEFNALLNAANKKLSEESEDSGEPQEQSSGGITQNQIDALLGGAVVDLTGGDPGSEKPAPKAKNAAVKKTKPAAEKKADPAPAPAAAPAGSAPEGAAEGGQDGKEKKKKEPKPKKPRPEKKPKPDKKAQAGGKDGKKEKASGRSGSFIITLLVAAVAGALGFCISLLMFGDLFRPEEEQFAVKAANAVNSKLNVNEKLCVYKAYVKRGTAADECIIYAVIDYNGSVTVTRYRVVVNRDTPNVINIYYPIDETSQAYIDMKNSDDPEKRIQASVLKNYSDTIDIANREILMGSNVWTEIDISKINSSITSKPTRNTGSSSGLQTTAGRTAGEEVSVDVDISDLED